MTAPKSVGLERRGQSTIPELAFEHRMKRSVPELNDSWALQFVAYGEIEG
jgi:hypothetical protein